MRVTVVVGDGSIMASERTLFSLACQTHDALEVRVGPDAASLLQRYRRLAPSIDWRTSSKEAPRSPAVSFLAAGDVVYPFHLNRLATALETSTAAWALSRARWAMTDDAIVGEPHCRAKQDVAADVPSAILRTGQLPLCAALFHLERMRLWILASGEGPPSQAALLRIALRCPPIALSGLASCESPVASLPLPVRAKSALKRNLPSVYGALKSAALRRRR